jgi:hypothetical protein
MDEYPDRESLRSLPVAISKPDVHVVDVLELLQLERVLLQRPQ